MSLNLGPVAFDAIVNLRNNPDWRRFVDALFEQTSTFMHRAIEIAPPERVDATGYARGLRDLHAHIMQVEDPLPCSRVPKPLVKAQGRG